MGRRVGAFAWALTATAWSSAVTWFTLGGTVLYTVMTCLSTNAELGIHNLQLQALETGLYVFNDSFFLTYGLLFCYAISVSVLLHPGDNEIFLSTRMRSRVEVWLGRVTALLLQSIIFLGVVWLAWLFMTVASHPISAGWSAAYDSILSVVHRTPDGLPPVYYLAADEYFRATSTPLGLVAVQSALFVLVYWTVGIFAAVLAQGIRRRVLATFSLVTYVFSYVVLLAMDQPGLTVITAQSPLLLSTHVPRTDPYLSYPMSFAIWAVLLLVLLAIGTAQLRQIRLG